MTDQSARFVSAGTRRLQVTRNGRSILRSAGVPKPFVLVDTREKNWNEENLSRGTTELRSSVVPRPRFQPPKQPLPLFANHPNWIAGERRKALKTGDYAVEEMEGALCLERKSLADIVACTVTYRERFLASCARLARFRWKAILIEATFEDIKGGFEPFDIPSGVHPNAVVGTLDAIEAKFGIPILYTSTVRRLATERAASWLSKHFTYWWLEKNGHGRVLIDSDEL